MVTLHIDGNDARNAAELIEIYFFTNIRDDPEMNNIDYVKSLIRVLDELRRVEREGKVSVKEVDSENQRG